jgi:hypothetical protein
MTGARIEAGWPRRECGLIHESRPRRTRPICDFTDILLFFDSVEGCYG